VVAGVEVALVTALLLAMVGLYAVHVILRNAGRGGVPSFQLAVQHMVLWVAMLGASLAVREKKHIAIEALDKVLRGLPKRLADALTALATAATSIFLAHVGWAYVVFERGQYEQAALPIPLFRLLSVDVPRWWSLVIIPAGLVVVAARFALRGIELLVAGEGERGRRAEGGLAALASSSDDGEGAGPGADRGAGAEASS
jgi:TRAP-type C4-dicarboxylate transport system permease small subunit